MCVCVHVLVERGAAHYSCVLHALSVNLHFTRTGAVESMLTEKGTLVRIITPTHALH